MTPQQVIDDLEFRLAMATSEMRAAEEELEDMRQRLKMAERFIPLAERIGYSLAIEAESARLEGSS